MYNVKQYSSGTGFLQTLGLNEKMIDFSIRVTSVYCNTLVLRNIFLEGFFSYVVEVLEFFKMCYTNMADTRYTY